MAYAKELRRLLRTLGVNQTYCGFEYTVYACGLAIEDKSRLKHITKGFYQDVAKKFNTSWKCVERDIRKIVETIWDYGDRELLMDICGKEYERRPKNTEFLDKMADYIVSIYGEAAISSEDE